MTVISPAMVEESGIHGAGKPCDDKGAGAGNDNSSLPTPTRSLAPSASQRVMRLRNEVAYCRVATTSWQLRPSIGSWLAKASKGKAAACAAVPALAPVVDACASLTAIESVAPPAMKSIAPPAATFPGIAPIAVIAPPAADSAQNQCRSQSTSFAPSPRLTPRLMSASEVADDTQAMDGSSSPACASRPAIAEDDAMLRSSPTQGERPSGTKDAEDDAMFRSSPMQGSRPLGKEDDDTGSAPGGIAPVGIAPAGIAPVGIAPVGVAVGGIAPVGIAPVGIAPVGIAP